MAVVAVVRPVRPAIVALLVSRSARPLVLLRPTRRLLHRTRLHGRAVAAIVVALAAAAIVVVEAVVAVVVVPAVGAIEVEAVTRAPVHLPVVLISALVGPVAELRL